MGNSEVGHTNIGAGRIVYQMLVKISKDINDGKIYENKALSDAMDAAKANGKSLHLMGLLSNGGVHSHNEHLYGLLKMAKKKVLKTYMFTHSLTVVTFLLHQVPNLWLNLKKKLKKSA